MSRAMPDTNTANPSAPLLSEAEQAWLDATPFGERRELTWCGRTFAVDRRFGSSPAPHVPSPQPAAVPTSIYIGDVIANPPGTGDSGIAPMTVVTKSAESITVRAEPHDGAHSQLQRIFDDAWALRWDEISKARTASPTA